MRSVVQQQGEHLFPQLGLPPPSFATIHEHVVLARVGMQVAIKGNSMLLGQPKKMFTKH